MVVFTILLLFLTIWPASAQNDERPLAGTTLSFLETNQTRDCPDASSLPSFHTTVDIPNRAALCLDVQDLFTHPNRTHMIVLQTVIQYQLTHPDAWNSNGNFSRLRYINGFADLNKNSGSAKYWITFYDGANCIQHDAPWMSFSCAETEGQCFQFPFNIGSFLLHQEEEDPGKHCHLNSVEGAGSRTGVNYGMNIFIFGLLAYFLAT